MKLTRFQDDLFDKTDQLMKENDLIEQEDYAKFVEETFDLKTGSKEIVIKIQLKNQEKIVKHLKKLGWKTKYKYYTNGSVNWCYDGDSKNNYGDIEIIQLIF
ncbi:hypothetical protein [Clostridium beijerinckii]|uniref:hypothetical protein n=1 Tax=Clostridium beijerinckii TaxID=1520 RepID=UPI0014949064|nr:hypothetical protein [Clostridium beijerinckii]NOW07240.1 hypothetical protein [Clostridium beijerinckii]NYC04986.1 hypothetical protein [Clostridium beijerinckii]